MPNDSPSSHPMLSCTDRLAIAWQDFLILCGRPLFGWIFMQSGWRKLMDMPAFIKSSLTDRGVPVAYGWLHRGAGRIGHRYWEFTGANYRAQHTQFWKNISMMGGQVLLFVTAGGRYSIDALLRRK